jgi:hypothetical protein
LQCGICPDGFLILIMNTNVTYFSSFFFLLFLDSRELLEVNLNPGGIMSSGFQCIVGGVSYPASLEMLKGVKNSYFEFALNETWLASGANSITIDRDGILFQYVFDYIRFGHLPYDRVGGCVISRDILEALLAEADFFCLSGLVEEINSLLKTNGNGMRYLTTQFYLNSGPERGLTLREYSTFDEAFAAYQKFSKGCESCADHVYGENEIGPNIRDAENWGQVVIKGKFIDEATGRVTFDTSEEGNWKRPQGIQLHCIPVTSAKVADGALYEAGVRTVPKVRNYSW